MAAKDVNKDNEADVLANMYLKKPKVKKKPKTTTRYKPPIKFKKGQFVRVSFQKKPFAKSYADQFSAEVFKVVSMKLIQDISVYKLQDLHGDNIQGHFYNSELLAINKDADSLWFVEKVLTKRRCGGKLQYYVKWNGFQKKFNSWVDSDRFCH